MPTRRLRVGVSRDDVVDVAGEITIGHSRRATRWKRETIRNPPRQCGGRADHGNRFGASFDDDLASGFHFIQQPREMLGRMGRLHALHRPSHSRIVTRQACQVVGRPLLS